MSRLARALARLEARPTTAAAIAAVYIVVAIAAHEEVNQAVRALQQAAGPERFRHAVAAFAGAIVAGLAIAIARQPTGRRPRLALGFALWIAGALLAWRYLFTVPSEGIHFPQYALLTILLQPLSGGIGGAMLAANLVGFVDEANQFWILHPDWGIYLDWNDIVLNGLGVLLGGLLLALGGAAPAARARSRLPAFAFAATALLLAGGSLLVAAGKIALRTPASGRPPGAWTVLDRADTSAQPFWITAEWAQKRYHVLQSEPGAALFALVAALALAIDRRERR